MWTWILSTRTNLGYPTTIKYFNRDYKKMIPFSILKLAKHLLWQQVRARCLYGECMTAVKSHSMTQYLLKSQKFLLNLFQFIKTSSSRTTWGTRKTTSAIKLSIGFMRQLQNHTNYKMEESISDCQMNLD